VVIGAGQTCAGKEVTLANVRVEKGGLLKPVSSHSIKLSGVFEAGDYQTFTNALPGQGKVYLSANIEARPIWWGANSEPGVTDITTATQAALDSGSQLCELAVAIGWDLCRCPLRSPGFMATACCFRQKTGPTFLTLPIRRL
jgi:hypothetical protein